MGNRVTGLWEVGFVDIDETAGVRLERAFYREAREDLCSYSPLEVREWVPGRY
jgi:hypothetical protein